jgi:outer membrane lipopolysaccharide assembly protein LptE/RlpB
VRPDTRHFVKNDPPDLTVLSSEIAVIVAAMNKRAARKLQQQIEALEAEERE